MPAPVFETRKELEAHQLARLRDVLAAIDGKNRFWTPRLREHGVDASLASLAEFEERMPLLGKDELSADQRAHPPYGTNLTFPLERYVRVHQTSGTTGTPLRVLDTHEDWAWMKAGWRQVWEGAGVTSRERLLFAFSFGPFIGFWLGFEAAQELGCLCIPAGPTDSVTRLELMAAHDVTFLCCTPTYALHLGELAQARGVDTPGLALHSIVVGGEPGGSVPAVRARIEALWNGARVFDHYGLSEVGPVTFQHRDAPCDVMHLMESSYVVEVLDPDSGEPLEPGTEGLGELVLTSLGRAGAPLLRYRTRDLVQPGPRAEVGNPYLTLRGGIRGRTDQMVVVRGVNLFPSAVDEIVRGVDGVAEYRVEVRRDRALVELKLVVEPLPGCEDPEALCARIQRRFRTAYSLRLPVDSAPIGDLPRFDLKASRWVEVE